MHPTSIAILALVCCYVVPCITAKVDALSSEENRSIIPTESNGNADVVLNRQKRTLLLKKKLIGAGLLGFGLGIAKGYKAGYYTAPRVHHVYRSSPPASVKYVEYVEKPIFVERIIERPTSYLKPISVEYSDPSTYGAW
ncbi:uncharacterized protein LOC143424373 [Xylocopa sonorina]|uniref:uncharacterized protein LOC143424373 n=1 Tax=Xylocopa sonorina TaxID=1818115 RepID=UPI00403AC2AB